MKRITMEQNKTVSATQLKISQKASFPGSHILPPPGASKENSKDFPLFVLSQAIIQHQFLPSDASQTLFFTGVGFVAVDWLILPCITFYYPGSMRGFLVAKLQ